MEKTIERMGLYDIIARGLTGTIVILASDLFGIFDLHGASEDNTPAWVILIAGYFCGLVLEEISYIFEKSRRLRKIRERFPVTKRLFISRSEIELKVCDMSEYRKYDYKCCKNALIENDNEHILDEPLAHMVMSSSFKIAFTVFLALKILYLVFCRDSISDTVFRQIVDILILAALIAVFHCSARHYSQRRAEQIFDYCIAKGYPGIMKKENKHEDESKD